MSVVNQSQKIANHHGWPWTEDTDSAIYKGIEWPKISIVTPSYNQGEFIEETILSVLNQNYPNLEYIIIDGGSTDDTIEIIKQYEHRITYWISEKDKGQSDAINKGFLRASGKIVGWLNSDDLLEKDALYSIAGFFSTNPDISFAFGDCLFFDDTMSYLNKIDTNDFKAKQLGLFPYSQPSCYFKSQIFKEIGYLDPGLRYCMDVDFFLRIALNYEMKYLNKTWSRFRLHPLSKTISQKRGFKTDWCIIYSDLLLSLDPDLKVLKLLKKFGMYSPSDKKYLFTKIFSSDDINRSFGYFLYNQIRDTKVTLGSFAKLLRIRIEMKKANSLLKDQIPFKKLLKQIIPGVGILKKASNRISDKVQRLEKNGIYGVKKTISIFIKPIITDYKKIPIIINNYNRLEFLQQQIDFLEYKGYTNITILDNNSNYQPLLEYYKKSSIPVIHLGENLGHLALWKKKGLFEKYKKSYYVYTDPDIIPLRECPDDFLRYFIEQFKTHKDVNKVGFSLKIDDLPDFYPFKETVINWESQFWSKKAGEDLYKANIDTTFAVYRPLFNHAECKNRCLRTGYPYTARHMTWYLNPGDLSEEESFFRDNINSSSTWIIKKDGTLSNNKKVNYLHYQSNFLK